MKFVLKGRIGGFFGGCDFSKLLISQFCAKTGEQKVINNKLRLGSRLPAVEPASYRAGAGRILLQLPDVFYDISKAATYIINCPQKWKKQREKHYYLAGYTLQIR
jgi:hypothetical protein